MKIMAFNLQMKDPCLRGNEHIIPFITGLAIKHQVDAILINELGSSKAHSPQHRVDAITAALAASNRRIRWYCEVVHAGDGREHYGCISNTPIAQSELHRVTINHGRNTRSGGNVSGLFGRRHIGIFTLREHHMKLCAYHAVPSNNRSLDGLLNIPKSLPTGRYAIIGDFNISDGNPVIAEQLEKASGEGLFSFKRSSRKTHRVGRLDFGMGLGRVRITSCERMCSPEESVSDHSPILVVTS